MGKPRVHKPIYFRAPPGLKLALDQLVARLGARGFMTPAGDRVISQEAVIGGLILWAEELGVERVADGIAKHLPRLAEMLGVADPPADPPLTFIHGDNPDDKAAARRRKRKGG